MLWNIPRLDKSALWLAVGVFCLLLSATTLLTTSGQTTPFIHADGEGYYLFLPATFIYHDLTMQWTQPLRTSHPRVLTPNPASDGLNVYRPGVYLEKYTIGMAILWLPFFLAAHTLALLTSHPATGFTAWYQASIGFAAAIFGSLGCMMIYKILRQHFSAKVSFFTVLTLLLGTDLLSYATFDGSFTHIYSLFLIASLLYVTPRWYGKPTYRTSLLLACILALTVLVRQTNILIVIVPLLWNVTSRAGLRQRLTWLWRQRAKLALMAGAGLILALPQLLYWHYITGHWLIYSYQGESFNFLHPQIINILFSTDRGVFFWAPVLLLFLGGLALLRRHLTEWSTALYVFLPIWLWVISSWYSWQFGDGYGHRAFIDMFPLLALALATAYSRIRRPVTRKAVTIFVVLCIIANVFMTYQYWIAGLAGGGTTLHGYLRVWWLGLHSLYYGGLQFGLLGLIALVCITLGPVTHHFLTVREPRQNTP